MNDLAAAKYKTLPKPTVDPDSDAQPSTNLHLGRSVSEGAKSSPHTTDGKFVVKVKLPLGIVTLLPGGQTRSFNITIVEHNRSWDPSRLLSWVDEELTGKYRVVTELDDYEFSPTFKTLAELQLKGTDQVSLIPPGTTSSPNTSNTTSTSTSTTTTAPTLTTSGSMVSLLAAQFVPPPVTRDSSTALPSKLLVQGLASKYRDSIKSVGR